MATVHERVLKQERIRDGEPDDYTREYVIKRVLRCTAENGVMAFRWHRDGPDDTPMTLVEALNLNVYKDTEFHLRLSRSWNWEWSRGFDAITTKKDKKKHYGKLQYEKEAGNFVDWNGQKPRDWSCKRIKFLASLNEVANSVSLHGYSLNIDLVFSNNLFLPISIDPDLENPKGLRAVPDDEAGPGLLFARSWDGTVEEGGPTV